MPSDDKGIGVQVNIYQQNSDMLAEIGEKHLYPGFLLKMG